MKSNKLLLILVLLAANESAIAGAAAGGSSEVTQILNNVQLVLSYAQQVEQYSTQLQQFEAQIKNLEKNPSSNMSGDTAHLIQRIGGIMSAGQSMGGSLAEIDRKFAATYNSPQAASYSDNFKRWTNANKDTLQSSMQSAGLRRDQYGSDASALQALYNESQSSGGNLAALQTLSKINIQQIQQTQALGDLMATQNIASSTYMSTQNAKAVESQNAYELISKPYTRPIPPIEQAQSIKWNEILFKK